MQKEELKIDFRHIKKDESPHQQEPVLKKTRNQIELTNKPQNKDKYLQNSNKEDQNSSRSQYKKQQFPYELSNQESPPLKSKIPDKNKEKIHLYVP